MYHSFLASLFTLSFPSSSMLFILHKICNYCNTKWNIFRSFSKKFHFLQKIHTFYTLDTSGRKLLLHLANTAHGKTEILPLQKQKFSPAFFKRLRVNEVRMTGIYTNLWASLRVRPHCGPCQPALRAGQKSPPALPLSTAGRRLFPRFHPAGGRRSAPVSDR